MTSLTFPLSFGRTVIPCEKTTPRRQRGNTLLGLVIGIVIGLAVAVGVALYITNAPLPFVTKVRPIGAVEPGKGALPDPNKPLNPDVKTPAPATTPAPVPSPAATPAPQTPAAATASAPPTKDELPVTEGTRFLLQAGAFKTPDDADGMRARLALIGLDARVYPVESGGQQMFRVRLGPYGQLDDVNRVRRLLAENGIDAQIVRLR